MESLHGHQVRLRSAGFFVGDSCVVPSLAEERHPGVWDMKSSICLPGTRRAVCISSCHRLAVSPFAHLFESCINDFPGTPESFLEGGNILPHWSATFLQLLKLTLGIGREKKKNKP